MHAAHSFPDRGHRGPEVGPLSSRRHRVRPDSRATYEWLAPASVLTVLAAVLSMPASPLTAAIAIAAAIIHFIRLYGGHTRKYWSVPLLWVLHLGYAWIAFGFLLVALAALGIVSASLALHAFTAGAMGTLILGMMARVSLGHTGRILEPARVIELAFAVIVLAAVARVFGPLLMPAAQAGAILVSGLLWTAAFALFTLVYVAMLIHSRVDGKPG